MITYGSYISHKEDLPSSAIWVCLPCLGISIARRFNGYSASISFRIKSKCRSRTYSFTMPAVFAKFSPSLISFAFCFYGCLFVAALTSMISLFEVPLAYLMDEWHFKTQICSNSFICLSNYLQHSLCACNGSVVRY